MTWRSVSGHDGYWVSNLGHVRGPSGRVLKQERHHKGYTRVPLRGRKFYVHCLVAAAFLPGWSPELQVRHRDGRRDHNRASNLTLGTQADNEADKRLHGTHCVGLRNGSAKFSAAAVEAVRNTPKARLRTVATEHGMSYDHALAVRRGRYRKEA